MTAALVFSLASCGMPSDFVGDPDKFFGLLINSDPESDLLAGIRRESGESVSVFGRTLADGSPDIQEVVYEDAQGRAGSLRFESGFPVVALLDDGSRLDITYEQKDTTRLKGTVKAFVASTGETHESAFDVDLQMALAQLAQTVEDLTGGAVQVAENSGATAPDARSAGLDGQSPRKSDQSRHQLVGQLMFVGILTGAGFLMVCAMTQMMEAMLAVATATTQAVIITLFMPFIIMGEICRTAAAPPGIFIDVEVPPYYLPPRHQF